MSPAARTFSHLLVLVLFVATATADAASAAPDRPGTQDPAGQARKDVYAEGSVEEVRAAIAKVEDPAYFTAGAPTWSSPLFRAAASNPDPEVLRTLIEAGADVHARAEQALSVLHAAVHNSNPAVAEVLLGLGFDVDVVNDHGWTPLMAAVQFSGDPEMVALLLEAGAEVDRDAGGTALHMALSAGCPLATVELLLAGGADVHKRMGDRGGTPLLVAATKHPDPAVCERLIRAGAKVDARSAQGATALVAAAQNNNADVVRVLLEAGADVHARTRDTGSTALHAAAGATRSLQVINEFLAAGADPNARDALGFTPLMVAAVRSGREGHPGESIIQRLLAARADPNALHPSGADALRMLLMNEKVLGTDVRALVLYGADVDRVSERKSPLFLVIEGKFPLELVEILLEAGADPNLDTAQAWPPLMLEMEKHQRPEVVAALLDAGADPNIALPVGLTPVGAGVANGAPTEVMKLLLDAGGDPDATMLNGQPALLAAILLSPPVARLLVASGADRGAVVENGLPILPYLVAGKAKLETVQLALELGIDVDQAGEKDGATALVIACAVAEDPRVVEALLEAGADARVTIQGQGLMDLARRNRALRGTEALRALERAVAEEGP